MGSAEYCGALYPEGQLAIQTDARSGPSAHHPPGLIIDRCLVRAKEIIDEAQEFGRPFKMWQVAATLN
jgi:hypothetical protein